ncbi:MAG: S24 family peptidase [Nitrospiraceae bacterium]
MNQRYERAIATLARGQDAQMRVFGNSMLPLIQTKSTVTLRRTNDYQVGDVVFVKVGGNIYVHKITKVDEQGRYMIANNKGRENGWTSAVYARVIAVNGEPFGRPVKLTTEP